ncbi:hypothetical protein T492DRAFT_1100837, partial [Pavlovales sp. CCMP2436]
PPAESASMLVHPPTSPRAQAAFGSTAPRATPSGHMPHHFSRPGTNPSQPHTTRESAPDANSEGPAGVRQAPLPSDWRPHLRTNIANSAPMNTTSKNGAEGLNHPEALPRGSVTLCCGEAHEGFCCARHHPDPLVVCCELHDPLPLYRILKAAQKVDDGRQRGPRGYKQVCNIS